MENLERNEAVQVSSERSFGIVFTVVFALIALFPLLHGAPPRLWSLAAAAAFLAAALLRPALLGPLNRLWFRFGMLLHRIVSPVAMGIIFFGAIMPMGLANHAAYADAAAALMRVFVKFAWPAHLETVEPYRQDNKVEVKR